MKNEKDLKLIEKWLRKYKASEDYCEPFFEKGRENYKLYKSYIEKDKSVYKHNIFVPYAFAYAEDMTAYLMLSILASPITFSLEPRMTGISRDLCMELEQIIHFILTEESTEFILELDEIIKNVNIFNVGYVINYPILSADGNFERLHLDSPCPLDIYPEPNVKRISRMNWIIKKSWDNIENLRKLEKKEKYKNISGIETGFTKDDPIIQLLSDIGISTKETFYDEKSGKVELLDCIEMNGKEVDVITIAGMNTIIQDTTENEVVPFSQNPILDCRLSGAPGEFFGVGVIESIKPSQNELNLLRSQRRDNIALLLNKLFVYDILAGEVDLSTLFSAPGNVIVTTNKEALDELKISDVTASSYKESQELQYDMQNVSSMWDYARGGTPRRRETATGIIRLQQAAQSRNELLLRKVDAYILQPLCKRILVYIREGLSKDDYEKIIGKDNKSEEFYKLSPEEVMRVFKVMPLTESIVSVKELNINQFIMAFDRLIRLPEVNKPALIKQLLQKVGQKDIKEILPMLSPESRDIVSAGMPGGAPGMPQPGPPGFVPPGQGSSPMMPPITGA